MTTNSNIPACEKAGDLDDYRYRLCIVLSFSGDMPVKLEYVCGQLNADCDDTCAPWNVTQWQDGVNKYRTSARVLALFILAHIYGNTGDTYKLAKKRGRIHTTFVSPYTDWKNGAVDLSHLYTSINNAIDDIHKAERKYFGYERKMTPLLKHLSFLCNKELLRLGTSTKGLIRASYRRSGTEFSIQPTAIFGADDVYILDIAKIHERLGSKRFDIGTFMNATAPAKLRALSLHKQADAEKIFNTFCLFTNYPDAIPSKKDRAALLSIVEAANPNNYAPDKKRSLSLAPDRDSGVAAASRNLPLGDGHTFEMNTAREDAWKRISDPDKFSVLVDYYQEHHVPCFEYTSTCRGLTKMPLLVQESWLNLSGDSLDITLDDGDTQYAPSDYQKDFFEFYANYKNLDREWNDRLFSLSKIIESDGKLTLSCEIGRYFNSLMCQYVLEDELIMALAAGKDPNSVLPIRESVASDINMIMQFGRQNVMRMGVSNLLLLRDADSYIAQIHVRGDLSMGQGLDTVSSGVFSIQGPARDGVVDIREQVYREIREELYNDKSAARATNAYAIPSTKGHAAVSKIQNMIRDGSAVFMITGFCIDLVRLVPDITAVLVINDPSFVEEERQHWVLNEEYHRSSEIRIPSKIDDIDKVLAHEFPSDTESVPLQKGFDPLNWTLPGAFCLHQGLHRCSSAGIL